MNEVNKERLLDLLADQALLGLTEAEVTELENLKQQFPEFYDDDSFELAAAAINLSFLKVDEELPQRIQARVLNDADAFFAMSEKQLQKSSFVPQSNNPAAAAEAVTNVVENSPSTPWWNWLGWGVAALACVALAVNLWFMRSQQKDPVVAVNNPQITPTPIPPLSAAQEREKLMASARDLVKTSWAEVDPKKPKNISGEVVWSSTEQKGFISFRGLPANDKSAEQYQLWIFDANQDAKTPVDGGVFDVSETGEVIIPINAKLKVEKPIQFAVTAEKPGGVVVSKLGKIMTIAKV